MSAGKFLKPAMAGIFVMALASCEDGGLSGTSGSDRFRKDYTAARSALEAGQFATANRIYARMLESAGPLESRIRLEYAHSLLRGGAYDQAAAQAQGLANSQTGTARSAALSVLGVARHEMGLSALADGDAAGGRAHLIAARTAMAEVLANDPDLDPLGALAGRQASIAVRLKALG